MKAESDFKGGRILIMTRIHPDGTGRNCKRLLTEFSIVNKENKVILVAVQSGEKKMLSLQKDLREYKAGSSLGYIHHIAGA